MISRIIETELLLSAEAKLRLTTHPIIVLLCIQKYCSSYSEKTQKTKQYEIICT